jgi:hypothetical protein
MFKFMMLFRQPANIVAFENAYNELLAKVEIMPDILRRQVIHVTGSPSGQSPYYRILEVYYENEAQMRMSMLSAAGQAAGGQIQTFPVDSFEMIFAEVYEETGGQTITGANE